MVSKSILMFVTTMLMCLAAGSAVAMSVSPLHIEMTSVGSSGRSQFTVTNSSPAPLPVETTLKRLELDENGTVKAVAAGDEFLVFPPQAMIPAGGSQVFRVQWVGEPNLARSQTYMLAVAEVPVKIPKGRSGVQLAFSFGIVIDVAPPQGQPDLKLVSTGVATDKQGKRHPTITVADNSNVHGMLELTVLRLRAGSWSKTYQPSEIAQSIGIGLVQPGKQRKFILPDELPSGTTTFEASLDYQQRQ